MARIMKLKEKQYYDELFYDIFGSPLDKSIDVYETKEELSGEKPLCVALDSDKTGYIPLVTSGIRASKINIQGEDGIAYKLAVQKKNFWEEIVSCKMKLDLKNAISSNITIYEGTYGTNFIQSSLVNKSGLVRVSATPKFYNAKGENITPSLFYNELSIPAVFSINVYLSNYGTGNTYEFSKAYSEKLITGAYSYINQNFTVTYNLSSENFYDSTAFVVEVYTTNSKNSITGKMTFNSLTINGKQIPVTCSL